MKLVAGLIAAAIALSLAPAATANANIAENNELYLIEQWTHAYPFQVLDDTTLEGIRLAASDLADEGVDISGILPTPMGPGPHVGEVWTINFGAASGADMGLVGCLVAPLHWAYFQWVNDQPQVNVPFGIHIAWTQQHVGLEFIGVHASGQHTGTNCLLFNSAFFSFVVGDGVFRA